MKNLISFGLAGIYLCTFPAKIMAEEYEVGQKNKQFSEKRLIIKKGDTVRFTNQDPFFHNIYSLSPEKPFDLGSFPKGKSRSVTFEKKGTIDVRCAIHPSMHVVVEVVE